MLGLFSLFGRSKDIQRLDRAVRDVGLHPMLVPDAVKITAVKLLKEAGAADETGHARGAEMLAYSLLGANGYADANGPEAEAALDSRLRAALEAGEGLDAQLVLLALQAGLAHPALVERHGLSAEG